MRQCKQCKTDFLPNRHRKYYCSRACHVAHNGWVSWNDPIKLEKARAARRKRRAVEAGRTYSEKEVFERDDWRCGICNKKVDSRKVAPHPNAPSIDHILPVSLGGRDEESNVQCAHLRCNIAKSDRTGYQMRLWG